MAAIGYGILAGAGFLATFVPPVVQFAQGNKLDKNEYVPNVGIPVLVGFFALTIGVFGLVSSNYNESLLFYIIVPLLLGSMLISIGGSLMYATRLRYAAD